MGSKTPTRTCLLPYTNTHNQSNETGDVLAKAHQKTGNVLGCIRNTHTTEQLWLKRQSYVKNPQKTPGKRSLDAICRHRFKPLNDGNSGVVLDKLPEDTRYGSVWNSLNQIKTLNRTKGGIPLILCRALQTTSKREIYLHEVPIIELTEVKKGTDILSKSDDETLAANTFANATVPGKNLLSSNNHNLVILRTPETVATSLKHVLVASQCAASAPVVKVSKSRRPSETKVKAKEPKNIPPPSKTLPNVKTPRKPKLLVDKRQDNISKYKNIIELFKKISGHTDAYHIADILLGDTEFYVPNGGVVPEYHPHTVHHIEENRDHFEDKANTHEGCCPQQQRHVKFHPGTKVNNQPEPTYRTQSQDKFHPDTEVNIQPDLSYYDQRQTQFDPDTDINIERELSGCNRSQSKFHLDSKVHIEPKPTECTQSQSQSAVHNQHQTSVHHQELQNDMSGDLNAGVDANRILLRQFLSRHPELKREKSPWVKERREMEGQYTRSHRGHSRGSYMGSLPKSMSDNDTIASMYTRCLTSEYATPRSSRRSHKRPSRLRSLESPRLQNITALSPRVPQPQLMLPLRERTQAAGDDNTQNDHLCLAGEQLFKPTAATDRRLQQKKCGGDVAGGTALPPIHVQDGRDNQLGLSLDASLDITSMARQMTNITDFVATDFGFHLDRTHENAGMSMQKFVRPEDLANDVASSANKHIYVMQNSHMISRNSKASEGIANVRRTLYPFIEKERKKENTSERAVYLHEKPHRDVTVSERQPIRRNQQSRHHTKHDGSKPSVQLPPIGVSKLDVSRQEC